MSKIIATEVWKRKTVQFAISLMRLIQVMQAVAEVELRAPAHACPACGRRAEVIVLPNRLCGECWSRNAIAEWKVPEPKEEKRNPLETA